MEHYRSKDPIMNKTFLAMMDELGYDVELVYKKKQVDMQNA